MEPRIKIISTDQWGRWYDHNDLNGEHPERFLSCFEIEAALKYRVAKRMMDDSVIPLNLLIDYKRNSPDGEAIFKLLEARGDKLITYEYMGCVSG